MSSRIAEMPRYLSQFRERFEGYRAVRAWAEAALEGCDSFPGFLTSVKQMFAGKVSSDLQKELENNCNSCLEGVSAHRVWLKGIVDNATDAFALGEEKLEKLLRIRGFDLTPKEMLEIGEDYLLRMREQRKAIARNISPDGNMDTVNTIIRKDCPPTFEDVLKETTRKTDEAMRFISEHDLVTLGGGAMLNIVETPEFLRPSLPTAALMTPAKFDEVQSGAYLITRPRNEGDIHSLWNRAMIINTTVHEAYPGHFLQGVLSNRMPWMHQLPHMLTMTDTMTPPYETCEGWAHYCEEMMYDEGFEATDHAAIAMLDAGIWRACRTVYDIKLHSGRASLEEMANFLASESNAPVSAAMEDVVGFSRTPAYPLSYLIGKHLVTGLRSELRKELGDRFDRRRFHDLLAENGNLPFHIVKRVIWQEMTGRSEV